ncbi:MAG: hypothetical protein NVS3B10_14450 [Polyangiales bacterium]
MPPTGMSFGSSCRKNWPIAAEEKTRIDVVQIGGRAPEPIPEVNAEGVVNGLRRDEDGKPITTELSAEGEAQLAEIAKATGGAIVRAERGETGIDEVARGLKRMMREELAERVETAFDEEYMWPLGVAVLLLVIEGLVPEAPLPKRPSGVLAMPSRTGRIRPERRDKPSRPDKRQRVDITSGRGEKKRSKA